MSNDSAVVEPASCQRELAEAFVRRNAGLLCLSAGMVPSRKKHGYPDARLASLVRYADSDKPYEEYWFWRTAGTSCEWRYITGAHWALEGATPTSAWVESDCAIPPVLIAIAQFLPKEVLQG